MFSVFISAYGANSGLYKTLGFRYFKELRQLGAPTLNKDGMGKLTAVLQRKY